MDQGRTDRQLEAITDEGVFEKLAMSILRCAEPMYRALVHPGINADGKTVRSPVDGIGFVPGAQPPHMVIVHHTTTKRDALQRKWIGTGGPKPIHGRGATTEVSDVFKAAEIAREQRTIEPNLQITLVLTTNREPNEETVRLVQAACAREGISLDLRTRSSLAHFLDTDADGQWLRHVYLGDEPERLSKPLLQKLSKDSLAALPVHESPREWIPRALDQDLAATTRCGTTFLAAPSGFGKTTACYKLLERHLADDGSGLVLPPAAIRRALTLDDAVDLALRALHPSLVRGAGSAALALCTNDKPLLLIVEDINRSGDATTLAEKLISWDRRAESNREAATPPYRLVCPIWPELLNALQERSRRTVASRQVYGSSFTPQEGRLAVQNRAKISGAHLSDMSADSISAALGNDPLLIALHDPRNPAGPDVIGEFIDNRILILATARKGHPATRYRLALRSFAATALLRRRLDPSWAELECWGEVNDEDRSLVGQLAHSGDIVQLVGGSEDQRFTYRHDRVRDWLLIDAAADLARRGALPDEILSDPYFAEIVAGILAKRPSIDGFLDIVRQKNPLALFHALRGLPYQSEDYRQTLAAIDSWFDSRETAPRECQQLRWEVASALSQTESPDVLRLVQRLGENNWATMRARLRNGDIGGGIELCYRVEPGSGAPWRDIQIAHAKQKYGTRLINPVGLALRDEALSDHTRTGLVRLSGHFAEASLGPALESSWLLDNRRDSRLADYIWAFAQCCGDEPERYLKPICDTWAALPAEREEPGRSSQRDNLAAFGVRWAFRQWPPRSAIPYFVKRAEQQELRWPITFMLSPIDDVAALTFVVREAANYQRRAEANQSFSHFASTVSHDWSDRLDRGGIIMSQESRSALELMWLDPLADKHVQQVAFHLWAATRRDSDLAVLRRPDLPAQLNNAILRERLERNDHSAIPSLLAHITADKSDERWWWLSAKYVLSDEVVRALDAELSRRTVTAGHQWQPGSDTDSFTADLLMRMLPDEAEKILACYWSSLRYIGYFVQAALHVATPNARRMANEALSECPEPELLLKYIGQHIGLRTLGHPGITRSSQIEALAPYFAYMEKYDVEDLFETCNSHGWFKERLSLVDPFLRQGGGIVYVDGEPTFAALDSMAENKRSYLLDHWLDNYAKTGASLDVRMSCIAKWLQARGTMAAMSIAAQALVLHGRREDLAVLATPLADVNHGFEQIKANTIFAVRRRTLT